MLIERTGFLVKYAAKRLGAETVGRYADFRGRPLKKFLIISNGRTGSNLLVSFLRQSPNTRMYGEVLGGYFLRQGIVRRKIVKDGPGAYLDMMLARTLFETHVGMKILYLQLGQPYADRKEIPNLGEAYEALKRDRSLHIIHLRRQNLLDVALSEALARETNSFVGREYGDVKIELPVKWWLDNIGRLERWIDKYRKLFRDHPYMEMTYEDLTHDVEGSLEKICGFLELPTFPVEMQMRRQRRKSREAMIANYSALKDAFANTRYSDFFETSVE